MKNKIINILVILVVSLFTLTIGVKAATAIAASQITYNGTTVQETLDELIKVANQCPDNALCSKVKIGDYVSMTPTQTTYTISGELTGYSSNQTINPSELNLWRVISINSDGTIDMVSEYVSSTSVYFHGQEGYLNYVGALNTLANQYGNSKYTIRARHMGYKGQTSTITDTSKFTESAPWPTDTKDNSNETVGGGDVMYEKDTGLVTTALGKLNAYKVGTTSVTGYWLAARHYANDEGYNGLLWGGHSISDGTFIDFYDLYIYNDEWSSISSNGSLRPIVTLKSDVYSENGDGSSGTPWVLS